jgi:hypothetical protein
MSNRSGSVNTVAVCRGVVDDHAVVLGDVLAAELEVTGGGAAELDHRRAEPQHLLDRARQQRQVRTQPGELVRVLGQREHRVGEQVTGGVVAGDHQQLEEAVEIAVGEPLAADLRVDDRAPQVAGRVRAPLLGRGPRVGEHLGERRQERLGIGTVLRVV